MQLKFENFEQLYASKGLDPEALKGLSPKEVLEKVLAILPEKHLTSVAGYAKLVMLNEAQMDGRKIDWNDGSQRKYFPYFLVNKKEGGSGFGLACDGFGDVCSYAIVGSRLSSLSREEVIDGGKAWVKEYEEFML